MEDAFAQQQRQKLQQHTGSGLSQPSPTHNNHQLQAQSVTDNSNLGLSMIKSHQMPQLSRNLANQQPLPQGSPLSVIENLSQPQSQPQITIPPVPDDQVERVTHSYDAFGRAISASQEDPRTNRGGTAEETANTGSSADMEAWDFSDTNAVPESGPEPVQPSPQRPDIEAFPNANHVTAKSPPRSGPGSHRRKGSMSRRRSGDGSQELRDSALAQHSSYLKAESSNFKVRFALRGHLDVVRAVIFTGGGSPPEPEICTSGDDGVIKRWIIPASYGNFGASMSNSTSSDLDIQSYFTHRGHTGVVTSLAAYPCAESFSGGGRAPGDGWVFSGGQDATVRVWERGRVDPKATLYGHTDAVWAVCVLPSSAATVFGNDGFAADRILLASGAADGTVKIWAVSAPPQLSPSHAGSRRGLSGSRRHSISSGSGFPSSPQPSIATTTPFNYTLIHTITRQGIPASPSCITPLSVTGDTFIVSYTDASIIIFDTRTAEEVVGMASLETYDGTPATGVNAIVATTVGLDGSLSLDCGRALAEEDGVVHGATGLKGGVEGVVISGHEDRYIRFFDANSGKYTTTFAREVLLLDLLLIALHLGQCTYTMLAHPSAISSISLSPDGRELVSGGHDASLRFWSLETRSCTQEITSHRLMRGEGVCDVVWSQDGRWVVSAGGDGVVKVFAR
jgi:striatin 1/3/4